jgi:hypothetical protein
MLSLSAALLEHALSSRLTRRHYLLIFEDADLTAL